MNVIRIYQFNCCFITLKFQLILFMTEPLHHSTEANCSLVRPIFKTSLGRSILIFTCTRCWIDETYVISWVPTNKVFLFALFVSCCCCCSCCCFIVLLCFLSLYFLDPFFNSLFSHICMFIFSLFFLVLVCLFSSNWLNDYY